MTKIEKTHFCDGYTNCINVVSSRHLTEKELGYLKNSFQRLPGIFQSKLSRGSDGEEPLLFIVTGPDDWFENSRSSLVRASARSTKQPGYWGQVWGHYNEHSNELCVDIKVLEKAERMSDPEHHKRVINMGDGIVITSSDLPGQVDPQVVKADIERRLLHELGHAIDDLYVYEKSGLFESGSISSKYKDKLGMDDWKGVGDAQILSHVLNLLKYEAGYGLSGAEKVPEHYYQELMAASISFLLDPAAGDVIERYKKDHPDAIFPDIFIDAKKPLYEVFYNSSGYKDTFLYKLSQFLMRGAVGL